MGNLPYGNRWEGGIGHPFSNALTSYRRSWGFPLIFNFHTTFTRTPPNIKFLILWAAANGVHQNSLVKFVIFYWFYLSLSEYRTEKHTRRKALAV